MALLAGAVLLTLALNLSSVGVMMDILDGRPLRLPVREFGGFAPTVALTAAMTLTIAAGYVDFGMPALALLLIAVLGRRLHAAPRRRARASRRASTRTCRGAFCPRSCAR